MHDEKNSLRKEIRAFLKSDEAVKIAGEERTRQNSSVYCKNFFSKISGYELFKTVFAYYPLKNEFPVVGLLKQASSDGKNIGLPVVSGEELIFKQVFVENGGIVPIKAGSMGILEPCSEALQLFPHNETAKDLLPLAIFVPGLAFSKDGKRLGRGGGYYDRFLSKLCGLFKTEREKIRLIGVCYSQQLRDNIPCENFDIPVDIVLSENT